MDHLTSRPLRPGDSAALLELELAAEVAEPSDQATDLVEIQEELADPGLRLTDGSVAVLDGDRLVAAGGLVAHEPVDTWAAMLHAVVLPEYRRRGIGRSVVGQLLDKAATIHAAEHPELPGDVRLWLQQGRDSAAGFADAAGFTPRRYFFDMRVDLAAGQLAAPPQLDGMEIRPWTPADDDGTRLAYNASFADHWGSVPASIERWRNIFAESSSFRPELSRLAVRDGEVVGFVLTDEFDSETNARGYRSGYLDRVGTVRAARGRGVASALLLHVLRAIGESGCQYAELTVDADSPTGAGRLYERLGFRTRRRHEVRGLEIATLG